MLLGNLVEAYGAAQPILAGGHSRSFAICLLGGIGLALALATILGGTVLAVISIAIVPHAFAEVSGRVATAMVLGFVAGYLLS